MRVELRVSYNEIIDAIKKQLKEKYKIEDARFAEIIITKGSIDDNNRITKAEEVEFRIIGEMR